jgi:hypothetical protein
MAYLLQQTGVKLGMVDCPFTRDKDGGQWLDEWCELHFKVPSHPQAGFLLPHMLAYKSGLDKGSGEVIPMHPQVPTSTTLLLLLLLYFTIIIVSCALGSYSIHCCSS